MQDQLRRANWQELKTCYGRGEDVPILVCQLGSDEGEKREVARDAVYESIEHRGMIFQAAYYFAAGNVAYQALPAMAKALHEATPHQAYRIGAAMLKIAFEVKPPGEGVTVEMLSSEQKQVLIAIVDSDQYWLNSISLMLANYQLPYKRGELRAFLQGISPAQDKVLAGAGGANQGVAI